MKCTKCGGTFEAWYREDGIPNGVKFVSEEGSYTVCAECIIEMSRMSPEGKALVFEEMKPDPEQ